MSILKQRAANLPDIARLLVMLDELEDALTHIANTAEQARNPTVRSKWIAQRAKSAITGDNEWRKVNFPSNKAVTNDQDK